VTVFSPAVVEEPGVGDGDVEICWKVIAAPSDGVEGEAGYGATFAPEFFNLGGLKCASGLRRMDGRAPKNFIGHPVADAGKAFLHE
jgi:hypothetical protein